MKKIEARITLKACFACGKMLTPKEATKEHFYPRSMADGTPVVPMCREVNTLLGNLDMEVKQALIRKGISSVGEGTCIKKAIDDYLKEKRSLKLRELRVVAVSSLGQMRRVGIKSPKKYLAECNTKVQKVTTAPKLEISKDHLNFINYVRENLSKSYARRIEKRLSVGLSIGEICSKLIALPQWKKLPQNQRDFKIRLYRACVDHGVIQEVDSLLTKPLENHTINRPSNPDEAKPSGRESAPHGSP